MDIRVEHSDELRLAQLVRGCSWFMEILRAARFVDAPDWCVGAGALRDLVWGTLHGQFDPLAYRPGWRGSSLGGVGRSCGLSNSERSGR